MTAREVTWRLTAACLGVTFTATIAYALLVPSFLGLTDVARDALVAAAAAGGLATACVTGALVLAYAPAVVRTTRALSARKDPDARDRGKLLAAPRVASATLMAASVLASVAEYLSGAVARGASMAAAAFLFTASLVIHPAVRGALRPLLEALPPADDAPRVPAPVDRLPVRVALAVAVPSGAAALLATLIVSSHLSDTTRAQDEASTREFSLALAVPRVTAAPPSGADVAARVLAAGGVRLAAGTRAPRAVSPEPEVPSPASWSVPIALALAAVGGALGMRIGRSASRDLEAAARRMGAVGADDLPLPTTASGSIPEVWRMTLALDAVAGKLSAMARDQKRALTARAEAARLRAFVLAGVSHDLRGPLNSVLGFAGLLLSGVDGPVTPGQRESLEALTRGGRDLLRLVGDLLDAARLDAGRMTLTRDRVNVGELLAGARAAAIERAGVPGETAIRTDGDLDAEVVVDAARVPHALGALVAYALLRPGGTGAVLLRARDEGDTVQIAIHGEGTSPTREGLEQLFEPFDFAPSGARPPAGLGLAVGVARRMIELHGGSARAEAAPEGGLLLVTRLVRARRRA